MSLPSSSVSFGPGSVRGADTGAPGEVDYRLARQHLISEFRKGRLAQHEVCDAHPELVRAAKEASQPSDRDCPICEDEKLVLVSYVFGPRLPKHGRCITTAKEIKEPRPAPGRVRLLRRRGLPRVQLEPPRPHVHPQPRPLGVAPWPQPGPGAALGSTSVRTTSPGGISFVPRYVRRWTLAGPASGGRAQTEQ